MSLSCVGPFATPWTVAHLAPLCVEFSRQEHRGGLPCPSPGGLPNPGAEPSSAAPALAGGLFITSATWEAIYGLATAAAKSLQSCPTLCDPIPGILQAGTLEWVAISFSHA